MCRRLLQTTGLFMLSTFISRYLFAFFITFYSATLFATNSTLPSLIHYILEEVEAESIGNIYVPKSSESGKYRISWYFEEKNGEYLVEELILGSSQSTWQSIYTGKETELELNKVTSGYYRYRVKHCIGDVCSRFLVSDHIEISTLLIGPKNVTATQVDKVNTIVWDAVSLEQATSPLSINEQHNITQKNNVTQENTTYYIDMSINGSRFVSLGQAHGTQYIHNVSDEKARSYRIKACDLESCTEPSLPTVPIGGIKGPNDFYGELDNQGNILFNWDKVILAAQYKIEIRINGGQWFTLTKTNLNTYLFENPPEGELNFRISSCSPASCDSSSAVSYLSFNVPISLQCNNLTKNLNVYHNEKYYFFGNTSYEINIIPGISLAPISPKRTSVEQYWKLIPEQRHLENSAVLDFKLANTLSGGLFGYCNKSKTDNSVYLTYRNIDNSFSFIINVKPESDNKLKLSLLEQQTLIYQDGQNNLYVQINDHFLQLQNTYKSEWVVTQLTASQWNAAQLSLIDFKFENSPTGFTLISPNNNVKIIITKTGSGFQATGSIKINLLKTELLGY